MGQWKSTKPFGLIALIIFAIVIVGCGGGGSGGGTTISYGNIEGYVYVPVGSEPAARAAGQQAGYKTLINANVAASCGSTSKSTQTNASGYFKINSLPATRCTVVFSKTGYGSYSTSVTVTANITKIAGGSSGVTMSPSSSGSIEITTNVSGPEIIIDGDESNVTIPDSKSVIFNNISPGNHTVSVDYSGLEVTSQQVTVVEGQTVPVSITLPHTTGKFAFHVKTKPSESYYTEEIFTLNADGTDYKQITFLDKHSFRPTWSPDGTKIAFGSQEPYDNQDDYVANRKVYVMDSDGSNITEIYQEDVALYDWSPDGLKLLYNIGGFQSRDFYTMNIDGTDRSLLFEAPRGIWRARYSNDGTEIVANLDHGGWNFPLYIFSSDGSSYTKITDDGATYSYPYFTGDAMSVVHVYEPDIFAPDSDYGTCPESGEDFDCWEMLRRDRLYIIDRDGSNLRAINDFPDMRTYINGIVVDPINDIVFYSFSEYKSTSEIRATDLNGRNTTTIYSGSDWMYGLDWTSN